MSVTVTPSLSKQQIADFHEDGYIIVRNMLSTKEADELRRIVQQQVKRDAYPSSLKYPEPAKYTVSGNRLAEPGLTAIAEHPTVINTVESHLVSLAISLPTSRTCGHQEIEVAVRIAITNAGGLSVHQ